MATPGNFTEIKWTTKSDRMAPHERILEIGVATMDGKCRRIPHAQAVEDQWNGVSLFNVAINGIMVGVKVETTPDGHRYLKSMDDGDQPDSLLALPDCPDY